MEPAAWKKLDLLCQECTGEPRQISVATQLDGRLIFESKCAEGHELTVGFYIEELVLLRVAPEKVDRFVFPLSTQSDRKIVSLSPLLRCEYCHGRGLIHSVLYSPTGIALAYDCFGCENGRIIPQEIPFEKILAFCAEKRAADGEVSDYIAPDEIDRDLGRSAPRPS